MSPRSVLLCLTSIVLGAVLVLTGCSDDGDDAEGPDEQASQTPALSEKALETLVNTGAEQLASGDVEAARKTFTAVADIDPGNVLAHYNLGLIAQEDGDVDAAIAEYDAVLESDRAYGPALFNKALLLEKSDLEQSVALYRRAVKAQPEFAPSHMRLGYALLHLGEEQQGRKHLKRGLALDPSMEDVDPPDYR